MSVSIDCMHGLHAECRYSECRCDCHDADDASGRLAREVIRNAAIEGMATEHFAERHDVEQPKRNAWFSDDCLSSSHAGCTYGDDGCLCWCHETDDEPNVTSDVLWGEL